MNEDPVITYVEQRLNVYDLVDTDNTNDPVNHPSHYCYGGIETIDYILAKDMDFLLGQVCKYISRAGKKDPNKELEDLKKAEFYLKRKIQILEERNNA